MLTPEQAREQLNRSRDPEWKKKALAAVGGLSEPVRAIGWVFLERDLAGKETKDLDWDEKVQLHEEAARKLDAATTAERMVLWATFFPRLDARLLERAWQALKSAPYQQRYDRKPFRAPGDESATRERRFDWFQEMVEELTQYNSDLAWVAAWSAHLDPMATFSGPLLAAAIDEGGAEGEAVLQTLIDSASGTHEIGAMGTPVIRALLGAANPEGWAFIEKLLLAAQRQEGLRQSILESIDEGHPGAFRRMLRLILDHDLARFSATVHALNTWFEFAWDSVSVSVVNRTIERVLGLLEDPGMREKAIGTGTAEDAYLALWSVAFEDAHAAIEPAGRLLDDAAAERRFVGVHLLGQLKVPEKTLPYLLKAYDDEDLRIALHADSQFDGGGDMTEIDRSDLFERAERLLGRLPAKPTALEPIVWPWQVMVANRWTVVHTLLNYRGDRPPSRLFKHLPAMDSGARASVVRSLVNAGAVEPETRRILLQLAADPSPDVRERAIEGLSKSRVTAEEAIQLEGLLSRKADDLRRGVLALLFNQDDDDVLSSIDRLLAARKPEPRRAGLELIRSLAEAGRRAEECRTRTASYRDARPKLDPDEARQIQSILDAGRKVPTLDDALGLLNPAERTRPVAPVARDRLWLTPAALACLRSLSSLIHEHREASIMRESYLGEVGEELLGNVHWGFPDPKPPTPVAEDAARLPLREVWESWWASRPDALRDPDGLELIRSWVMSTYSFEAADEPGESVFSWAYPAGLRNEIQTAYAEKGIDELPYLEVVVSILPWLLRLHPAGGAVDFLLDAVETALARLPSPTPDEEPDDWRGALKLPSYMWLNAARRHRASCPEAWSAAHHVRLFGLLRWMDEPGMSLPRSRPSLGEVLSAYEAGGATKADLFDQLLGPDEEGLGSRYELREISGRKPDEDVQRYPVLREIVDRCRERILDVELDRGETPTAASSPALAIRYLPGMSALTRLLQAIGDLAFERSHSFWSSDMSKASVLSHLIRSTFPAEGDTLEAFATEVERLAIPDRRLVELALFAPQWARFVERALRWPQLEEAVWWLHSHTKGNDWRVDEEIREVWTAEAACRTALSGPDLIDGAVDVSWFHRVYKGLGPKRWPVLDEAALYASGGMGHTRARLFAAAMLGEVKKTELVERVQKKRHADSVRALGLLPLAKGTARDRDLLDRYKVIQEFVRSSKQFGAQRQANEKRAAAIALDNLARTAGYVDPIRLEWAMEAKAVADLADGPVTVEVDGVTVALAIDDQGQPDLTVSRAGKPLKTIPPAVKKHKKVVELAERKTELKQQASRVRKSLETAMCRGDIFTGDELKQLAGHAILSPLLHRLILVGEGIAGYPVEKGRALRDHAGRLEPVKPGESLRIAHPHDLFQLGDWHAWQRECFAAERVQPFKQVFRELYVLTEPERIESLRSLRYAGHQVNPRQAIALLGGRGWVNHPEEGVRRTFHDAGLTAGIGFLGGAYTPVEVEGLTIESVQFFRKGEWTPLPLTEIPPRIFSEAMRDLDLVVSVAHRGGVDPEATASTVEMRGSLLRETCELLGIGNVRVQGSHAMIDGALGHYSLHLGSGVVHRQPGGSLCIVPVHAQHRGRLFLPFADDDPKTAEVLSKALLLARDQEIQDPSILAQIRTAT
jgi:hypothetical protein